MPVKRILLFFIIIAMLSFALTLPRPSFAENMNEVIKKIAAEKEVQDRLRQKATAIGGEVKSLKKDLVTVSDKLQKSEANLMTNEQRLKELRQKREDYVQKIYSSQQSIGGIVSAAQRYSSNPFLSMLAHDDILSASRTRIVIKSAIPSIKQQSDYFKDQLQEIAKTENDIATSLRDEQEARKDLDVQKLKLASLLTERQKIYKETESQSKEQEQVVASLVEESKNLEELLNNIKSKVKRRPADLELSLSSIASVRLPVQGVIKTNFGEEDGLGATSKGITFETLPGARIVTPLQGIVKFAGSFKNYKQLLIIEHPQGYHSLIAGLDRIDTVVGASLVAGEPVGVTEQTAAPRVYYELRKDGNPVNPKTMLMAQNKEGKS